MLRGGDWDGARALYALAAEDQWAFARSLSAASRPKTKSAFALSAATLHERGGDPRKAADVARQALLDLEGANVDLSCKEALEKLARGAPTGEVR
jgi:hypothetical protein